MSTRHTVSACQGSVMDGGGAPGTLSLSAKLIGSRQVLEEAESLSSIVSLLIIPPGSSGSFQTDHEIVLK